MRLLTLAVLALLAAPQDPKPQLRRTLTLVNRGAETLRAGTQVSVNLYKRSESPQTLDVFVLHGGKILPSTYMNASAWFRLAADIAPGGRDAGYEVRYGEERAPRRDAEVFDFFEDFQVTDPSADRWECDRRLAFRRESQGLTVKELPGGGNEHAPLSLVPRLGSMDDAFIFDVDVYWDIPEQAGFGFAVTVDMARQAEVSKEDRERIAGLIRDLVAEEIQTRERATDALVKCGSSAIPQLEEAARSADAESRARSTAVLDAIYRVHPLFTTGLIASGTANPSRMIRVGSSRTLQKEAFGPKAASRITLMRTADGRGSVRWSPGNTVTSPLEGKPLRLRLSFWSERAGSIGEFRIIRVIRRRYLEHMPDAEFGPEKR